MNYRCLVKISSHQYPFRIKNHFLNLKLLPCQQSKRQSTLRNRKFLFSNSANFSQKKPAIIKIFQKILPLKPKSWLYLFVMNKTVKYICSKNKQKYFLIYYYLKIRIIWQNVAKKVLIKWLIRLEMALTDWLLKDATLLTIANQRSRK